jgi:outer membrane immunogenic protein
MLMKIFRAGILAFTLTSIVALASANAADIYRAPEPGTGGYKDGPAYVAVNWSGFYAGLNGGYGAGEFSDQLFDHNSNAFNGLGPEGIFGGGQIGYNWQGRFHPNLVIGVEADIQGSTIGDSQTLNGVSYKSNLDWFGTVRGRLGYAFDRTLVYATGGFAYGGIDNDVKYGSAGAHFAFKDTATGYVAGGGLEYKVTQAWSLKAEYQYLNFGKNDPVNSAGRGFSTFVGTKVEDDAFHTARIGLNYHVLPGYEPLK